MATNIPPPKPLSYEGQVVIPYINRTNDPTPSNNSFSVPTIWINTTSARCWILASKPQGVANWVLFAGQKGSILSINTPTGGPVTPTLGAISFTVGDGLQINGGSAPSSTAQFSLTTPSYVATLTTASSSFTQIVSIPVASGTSIVLEGKIIASNAGNTNLTGGNIMVCADGTAASIVGFPVINVQHTTTGVFRAIFSAGNLVIQVRAPSSALYNWKFNYSYTTVI